MNYLQSLFHAFACLLNTKLFLVVTDVISLVCDVVSDECCDCCHGDDTTTFYYEIDGITDKNDNENYDEDDDDDDDDIDECLVKRPTKVTFSPSPIKVGHTHSLLPWLHVIYNYFSLPGRPYEVILSRHTETCPKLFQNYFQDYYSS